MSKFGKMGGCPCLSIQGSWRRRIRFSLCRAKSCNAEMVVAWSLAQFSSCTDPTDARRAIYSATPTMGVSPMVAVLPKVRSLIRSGQFGSLALWDALQFTQRIGGWVQAGPFLQVGRVHGCSRVEWVPVQTAQQVPFRHSAAGCPYVWQLWHWVLRP